MLVLHTLLLAALGAGAAAAAAATAPLQERAPCTDPRIRREWRTLSDVERKEYTDAVNCLATKPSQLGLSSTHYDDFAFVHNWLDPQIHFVAAFLPWHRYFLAIYEAALQACGYTGVVPYWDWTLDVADVPASPILSGTQGFGGNGSPDKPIVLDGRVQRCVNDGPFVGLQPVYYGQGGALQPHCIMRRFNNGSEYIGDMFAQYYTPAVVQRIQDSLTTYDAYRRQLEGTPHAAVHSGIGGDMLPATSPNDPIFFAHHAQIDRLWWLWQQKDPAVRNVEYGGYRTQEQGNGMVPPLAAASDIMTMLGLGEELPVSEYMTTESERLCYRYE